MGCVRILKAFKNSFSLVRLAAPTKTYRRLLSKWHKRWWTLKGHFLYYYADRNDEQPKGIINLHEHTMLYTKYQAGKYLLRLDRGKKASMLAFTSEHERSAWVDALQNATKLVDKKARRKQEKLLRRQGPAIVVNTLSELPKECLSIIHKTDIPDAVYMQHFEVLLNVLRFRTGFQLRNAKPRVNRERDERLKAMQPKTEPVAFLSREPRLLDSNPRDSYTDMESVGKGGYGTVYRAQGPTGTVAIKVIANSTDKQRKTNMKEIALLTNLECENIVRCHEAYQQGKEVWVVMEYMQGGTISQACERHRFTEPHIAYICKGVVNALAYLHNLGLIHRDLKSANIMLTVNGDVKLIDFGLCVDNGTGPFVHMAGSPFWMPPEMILNEPHSIPADIWSFGICALELANGEAPNRKSSLKAMFTVATGGHIGFDAPESWSPAFTEFIEMCLQHDPFKRATAQQLSQHAFVDTNETRESMASLFEIVFSKPAVKKAANHSN